MWRRASLRALFLLLMPAIGWAGDWTISGLMASLRASAHELVWFDEEKRLGVLDVPLEQSGTLEYRKPNYLRKHVQVPQEQTFEIEGDRVRLLQPGRPVREMALGELPVLRALAEGLRAFLAGDLDELERHYRLELAGDQQGWTLTLTPHRRDVGAFINSIVFSGRDGQIARILVEESGGDSSVMRIRPST